MHGQCGQDNRGKERARKSGAGRRKRKEEEAEEQRKFSRFPVDYPISPEASITVKKYRHACNDCGGTSVADSQEAFCRYCGSNALIVTDVLKIFKRANP